MAADAKNGLDDIDLICQKLEDNPKPQNPRNARKKERKKQAAKVAGTPGKELFEESAERKTNKLKFSASARNARGIKHGKALGQREKSPASADIFGGFRALCPGHEARKRFVRAATGPTLPWYDLRTPVPR